MKQRCIVIGLILAVVCLAGIRMVAAQDDEPAPLPAVERIVDADTESGGRMGWQEIVKNGGWLMYVLAALSFLTVAVTLYFFAVLRAGQVAPSAFRRELAQKLRAGDTDEARNVCAYKPCALAAIAVTALDYMQDVPSVDPGFLKDVIEGEGSRQAEAIQGQTQYLLDIGAIAPMLGLLGTVFGMLRAFSGVAHDVASAKPVVLAAGVSQALVTTAFGLIVGIVAMAFYAYFRRKASRLVSTLESASVDVLTALLAEGRPAQAYESAGPEGGGRV